MVHDAVNLKKRAFLAAAVLIPLVFWAYPVFYSLGGSAFVRTHSLQAHVEMLLLVGPVLIGAPSLWLSVSGSPRAVVWLALYIGLAPVAWFLYLGMWSCLVGECL
jgi:hypothetical protein